LLRRQERSRQLGNVEFKNEPIIKNSRANPSSRIQERTRHQEFKINIFFRFLYSRYIPVTFLYIKNSRTNPSSRIQERTRHQEFKNEPVIKNFKIKQRIVVKKDQFMILVIAWIIEVGIGYQYLITRVN
jgi:hypothetical protein